jgi:leukotriene-A4 hydrolase
LKSNDVKELVFDTSALTIHTVYVNGEATTHELFPVAPPLGSKLVVTIPTHMQGANARVKVVMVYATSPEASAIQWLDAANTKGGQYPYVFTQSQAIHARSLFPCMDSPGVKAPYEAIVSAPEWATVLMSALQVDANTLVPIAMGSSNVVRPSEAASSKKRYFWNQPVPTSTYLVALAAGNLASKDISPRVRVWSEPEMIDATYNEFTGTEDFLQAAEAITGYAYPWQRYDLVCLPPSFPYGGMENPCLTFATPTLLAGDQSLADVVAHEIAHSWTGNLVSNVVWNHFWLNEGFTVWLERKITSYCKQHNVEVGKLSAQIGLKTLYESVSLLGEESGFTQVVWPLAGEDPDDAFSSVPYEKGFNLLNYLESIIGSELFSGFFKAYLQK